MIDGLKVRALRLARGWTQWDLGVNIGVQQSRICALERNKNRDMGYALRLAVALAKVFDTTVDALLFDEEKKKTGTSRSKTS